MAPPFWNLFRRPCDRDLSFGKHIKSLCRKAGQKLNTLARISNYLTHDQKRLLLNSIVKSQFSYCRLIWMFCSRSLNSLISLIHECALRLIHNDHVSTFQDIRRKQYIRIIWKVLLKKHTNFWMASHCLLWIVLSW